MSFISNQSLGHKSNNLYWIAIVFFVILTIRYQFSLLGYLEWSDETESIVTAKMIISGSRLYSEIFNLHEQLIFPSSYAGVLRC
jgi:hypothetical protein